MGKVAERTARDPETVEQVRRELQALPPGTTLSWEQVSSYVRRIGIEMPAGWSSADDIRELRGPLPDDETSVRE